MTRCIKICVFALALLYEMNAQNVDTGGIYAFYEKANKEALSTFYIDITPIIYAQGVRLVNRNLDICYDDPVRFVGFCENVSKAFLSPGRRLESISQYPFRILGSPAGGIGPPVSGKRCVRDNPTGYNELLQDSVFQDLPEVLIDPLNQLFSVMDQCAGICREAFPSHTIQKSWEESITAFECKESDYFKSLHEAEAFDMRKISYSSRLLTAGIMEFIHSCKNLQNMDLDQPVIVKSDFGQIGIFGKGSDTINGEYWFILDMGGNDVYQGNFAATKGPGQTVAILIDLEGDDKYSAEGNNTICRALYGNAILIDLEGDDMYSVEAPGLASTFFGFSMLADLEGDDTYLGKSNYTLGSSFYGAAIVYDEEGFDRYGSLNYAQGFGGYKGAGLLVDIHGDDIYHPVSENEDIYFVQGAAKGRWAAETDGHSLAGGIGILIDADGSDTYIAQGYAQGASYYFGTGILIDSHGDDIFQAVSHSQGYAVHYSLACLLEMNGNDKYNVRSDSIHISQIIGSGRDHSCGLFIEMAGNDNYCFGNRSVGISDMNGIGVFMDLEGEESFVHRKNNIYRSSGSCGQVFKPGGMMTSFELFPLKTNSAGMFFDYPETK